MTSPSKLVSPQLSSSPSFESFQHFCIIDTEETGSEEPMNFKNFSSLKPNKDLYRNFLEECKLAFKGNKISIGCNICDKTVSNFANGRELNSFYLKNLVKFKKNEDGFGGSFVYSRRHKPSIACLPSGYSQAAARQSMTRVSISREESREMTHFFLSWSGELNFYFSFSSRFSRI